MKFLFFITVCFLTACESTKNHTAGSHDINDLNGTWDLEYIYSDTSSFEKIFRAARPFIKFEVETKRISGKTGCNNFGGDLVVKDSTIDLTGPIAMTKMFCPDSGENEFVNMLPRITSYRIEDSRLMLNNRDTVLMRFNKQP